MITLNKIIKNLGAIAFGDIFTRLTGMAITILLARYLGPENYGKYALVVSFCYIFVVIADFGIDTLTIKDVARNHSIADNYVSFSFIVKPILACLCICILNLLVWILRYPRDILMCMSIFSIHLIFITLSHAISSIFKAFEKMEYSSLIEIINGLVGILLIVILIYSNASLLEIIFSRVVAFFIAFLVAVFILLKKFSKPSFELNLSFIKETLLHSVPFLTIGIIYVLYFKIDIIMLSKIKGNIYVGWYAPAANDIFFALFLIPRTVTSVMFPVFSRHFGTSLESFRKSTNFTIKILTVLGSATTVGTIFFAPQIIYFIFGKKYENSIIVLQIIASGITFVFLRDVLSYSLTAAEKVKTVMWINLFTLLLNVFLNAIFIPLYAHIGAALTSVTCLFISFILNYHYLQVNIHGIAISKNIIKSVLSAMIMILFIYLFRNVSVSLLIFSGAAIYLFAIFSLKTFDYSEISLLRNAITIKSSS